MTTLADRYDVLIAGGGLAGLCLALQIRRALPEAQILVAERSEYPAPPAAHKVGESSVEVSAHYFKQVLGLGDSLAQELPKFGLRFLMTEGNNSDVAKRLECGPSHFLTVPSYQIDRGQFENSLAERVRQSGVRIVDRCRVRDIQLGEETGDHRASLERAEGGHSVRCRWLVDAAGRSGLLRKQLDLEKPNRHNVNAAWFRVDHPIDLDDWSDDLNWQSRNKHSRRLSTNHLMGEGYWVWLIPLAGGRTSVGIVADERLHPFAEISSFDRARVWLERHEPQCGRIVGEQAHRKMDFRALKNYSHDVKRVFGRGRWCLVGDAGMFTDPLYSPGSDFIGIANGYVTQLIQRDLSGRDISASVEVFDQAYRSLGRTYLANYHRQYPLMGSPRVMVTKIIWDFTMYWGGVALLYFADKLCDVDFMERAQPLLRRFAGLNVRMQSLFRDWSTASNRCPTSPGCFVDYAELAFLANLNKELLDEYDDASLFAKLEQNLELAKALHREIQAEAARDLGGCQSSEAVKPTTEHLSAPFAAMRAEAPILR